MPVTFLTNEDKYELEQRLESMGNEIDVSKYGLPILHLVGDTSAMSKDNAVDLNYVYGDRSGTASVKWQGASSLSYPKKNYTIKFDNAFEAVEGWGEQNKYCLKANYIDFSHARNIVSAKLWGQVVKSRKAVPTELANLPNGGAIDGFPICVTINGEYHGVYTFNIPKDGWMFGMGSGSNECILCAEGASHGEGSTLFRTNAICDGSDWEIEYITDKNNTQWAVDSLNRLISKVLDSDGSDIDRIIAQYVDIDSAIDFLLFTCLISGGDNVGKNQLLATFDGVKWYFSTYDMDSVFGNKWTGKGYNSPATAQPSVEWFSALHKLFGLLVNYKTEAVKARYKELREGVLSEENVFTEFSNFIASIPKALYDRDPIIWPGIPGTKTNNLAQIVTNYMLRTPAIDKQVNALESIIIPYTNLVPTLEKLDSGEIYNGIGYKNDTTGMLDGADYTCSGFVTTGVFPYEIKSLNGEYPSIYIKGNVELSADYPDCKIIHYKSGKTPLFCNSGVGVFYYWEKTDLGDNYFKLTPTNLSEFANNVGLDTEYIRFVFKGTGEGLIITVGEPIE